MVMTTTIIHTLSQWELLALTQGIRIQLEQGKIEETSGKLLQEKLNRAVCAKLLFKRGGSV